MVTPDDPRSRCTQRRFVLQSLLAACIAMLCGCADEDETPNQAPVALFDVTADTSTPDQFFDLPYPSDLRLSADGTPDLDGFPNPDELEVVEGLREIAAERPGFPTTASGYFRFTGPLAELDVTELIPARADSPVLLVDIDPDSPDRGELWPTVATVLPTDRYAPEFLLAVAARPGFVLLPERTYAFVVTTALRDAQGRAVGADAPFELLRSGDDPGGADGAAAVALYQPLWSVLDELGVPRESVAAATVFTTGDVVAELAELSDRVREAYTVTIDSLALDPDDGADHDRFCELHGTVTFPQFQKGTPSFATEGRFELDADGLPIEQRQEAVPVVITLPKQPMPEAGYPLVMYFHGSGGLAAQVVDRGKVTTPDGEPTKGEGPAHVLAAHGFATVGSAHPVNPERVPGALEIEYLKFDNLAAFRDTFRQGVIEQRLYLDALLELELPPDVLAGCDGPSLPPGQPSYRFAAEPVLATGQSMGGVYTNIVGAVDPRIRAVVPTGAGGLWSLFILETELVGGKTLVPIVLGTAEEITFLHPGLQLLQTAWEPAEPMVYMPRLARRPLAGHPVRPIYEPVGLDDSYFPTTLYDAVVLAYGNSQAGDIVWPTMQESLALAGLDGIEPYPVQDNASSESGTPYTGVVVQYEGDGIYDPHAIYGQLDEVKYQYGCFFETFASTGSATVLAPAALGTPCTP